MRVILWLATLIFLIAGLVIYPVSRDWIIKKTVEFAISSGTTKLRIDSLKATSHEITIKGAHLFVSNVDTIKIEDIIVNYDLGEVLNNKKIIMHVTIGGETKILNEDSTISASLDYTATSLSKYTISINMDNLSSRLFSDLGLNPLQGKCSIVTTKNNQHISDCSISDGTAHLALGVKSDFSSNGLESFHAHGVTKALPIDLHKIFHHLFAKDATMQYLYNNISGALIKEGSWEMNLPPEFFSDLKMKPEYLSGTFNIENIFLRYDADFPAIEKINTILALKGSLLDFQISSAYTHNTKLENAHVLIDWGVEGDADVVIKADAKGPVSDLVDYIPKASMKSLIDSGIDLTKFAGTAASKVAMVIPIGDAKNQYDITTNIHGTKLAIFSNNVVMTGAKLDGSFDGHRVKIGGKCLINGLTSDLDFTNNLDDSAEFDNIVNLKINLAKQANEDTVPLYDFEEGKAVIDISYKDKKDKSYFSAKSNMTNIGFNVAKLGIHKDSGAKATLDVAGETASDGTLPLSITLIGPTIEMIGEAVIANQITKISFSKIVSNDTHIKAYIELEPKSVRTNISGNHIDLSKVNMMQFLTKDTSDTATDIKAKFDVVRLKNNILLDNFILTMKCSRTKCSEGIMNANIGSKVINLTLDPHDDHEEWKINITNAGAALKGFDMVNDIKSGELYMVIKTNISRAEAGKTVPIAEGDFSMTKFVTVDNKLLTRMVSFVSFPGLMSAITNNRNISFQEMKGKFSYKDNVITIYDGQATGPFLDLTMKGLIFTEEHKVKIKGKVIPSLFGTNQLVNKIPVLGTVFGGKHRKGIFSAPYSIEYNY